MLIPNFFNELKIMFRKKLKAKNIVNSELFLNLFQLIWNQHEILRFGTPY
jgi:hypothetical protein